MTLTSPEESPVVIGNGPHTVLCLHGWFGSSTGWGSSFVKLLDTQRFRYLFLDYRGYGERKDVPGKYTLDEIAEDALAVADDYDADTFSVLGHSMGASAMQRVLAMAPERVRAMIGIAPAPTNGTQFDEDGWSLYSGAAHDDSNREAIIDIATGNRLSAHWIDLMVRHSVAHSTREAFAAYLDAWAKTDHADEVPKDKSDSLVIVGEHDPRVNENTVRRTWLQHHPRSRLEVIQNAGHYPMFETPVRLATLIEEFLAGVSPNGTPAGDV